MKINLRNWAVLIGAIGTFSLLAGSPAYTQVKPVYSQNPVTGDATQQQQITVPSGQSITVDSGASLTCLPGSTCTGTSSGISRTLQSFGADPTGVADSSSAITTAAAWSNDNNGIVTCGGIFRVDAGVSPAGWFHLQGVGWTEIGLNNTPYAGCIINQTNTANPVFTFANAHNKGSEVDHVQFNQPQPVPGVGWTPTVYAPAISIANVGGEIYLHDINFEGVYQGVYSLNSGRTTLRRIRGQTFSYTAFIDNSGASDLNHLDDFHIWPYWSSDANVMAWQQANGVVLKLGRVDSLQSDHIFGLGYKACLQTVGNTAGPATAIDIGSLNCDASLYSVWDDDTTSYSHVSYSTDLHIGKLQCGGGSLAGSQCIQIDGYNPRIDVGHVAPVTVDGSVVNISTPSSAAPGAIIRLGSITGEGSSFNLSGTAPVFNIPSNAGFPHQVSLSAPIVPSNGGHHSDNTYSGLTNKNTATGAGVVFAAGGENWYNPAVVNAGTYQIPNCVNNFMPSAAGTLATITFALPDQPVDGKTVTITPNNALTSVTWTSGSSVFGAPSSMTAWQGVTLKYLQASTAWERVQ